MPLEPDAGSTILGKTARAHATRTEVATAAIIEIAQAHPAGARLGTKEALRAQCGVSVGTFNEALALVQSRGYISLRPGPGGGIFVNEQSAMARLGDTILSLDTAEPSIADAIRIRDALDPLLVDDAIAQANVETIAQLRSCLADMRVAAQEARYVDFAQANWRLHRVLAEASPAWLLRSIYLSVLDILQKHTVGLSSGGNSDLPQYIAERYALHEQIVAAIEARDTALAQELMRTHNLSG